MSEQGLRYNKEKLKWSYIPFFALEPMIEVLDFGKQKYSIIFTSKLEKYINDIIWQKSSQEHVKNVDSTKPTLSPKDCVGVATKIGKLKSVEIVRRQEQYVPEDYAINAMINGSRITIQSTTKDKNKIVEIGEKLIKNNILNLKEIDTERNNLILSSERKEGRTIITEDTGFQPQSLIILKNKDVNSVAIKAKPCTQIIVMKLEDLEVSFAVSAITGLDSSMTLLTFLEELLNISLNSKDFIISGDWNWTKGLSWTECTESLLRHTHAFLGGEDHDKESKLHHIGHMMCNVLFLSYMILTGKGTDDREKYLAEDE